jgi:16S rRNA (guanine527-N7)-methyltransferase
VGEHETSSPVPPELRADLEGFVALLCQWQSTHNLVSRGSLEDVWTRHIADSLQLLNHAPDTFRTWLDLGTGAGFPGFIVALACKDAYPERRFTLIEANGKKAAFLRAAARQGGVFADIIDQRIETYAAAPPRVYDVVSTRALAPLTRICELAAPFLRRESSVLMLLKGQDFQREIDDATGSWEFDLSTFPSVTDPDGRILALRNLSRTDLS